LVAYEADNAYETSPLADLKNSAVGVQIKPVNHGPVRRDRAHAATSAMSCFRRHAEGKSASRRGKTIDRKVEAVIHFASSLKATAPEIAPGAFLCCSDTRQWVMEAGYFQTRPNTDQRAHPDSRGPADR
jgi:hypothetical protein